jgi:hypothetical protein
MTTYAPVPVPAIPPLPPQLSLLSCAITPPSNDGDDGTDDSALNLDYLPSDLKLELSLGKPGTAGRKEPWIKGLGYIPRSGGAATARALGDETTVMDNQSNEDSVIFIPVAAWTSFTLSALDYQAEDFEDRCRQQLEAAMPAAIEAEFWSGTIAQAAGLPNNYLTNDPTNVTPGSGPVSVLAGLGMLQTQLRKGMGGQGMIHVTPEAVPNLLNSRRAGKYLLDMFDNIIIPGVGYPGTGPDGAAPETGTTWMYATDLVCCRVAKDITIYPSSFAEALDRGQNGAPNSITFRAFQIFAAYFDGFRQFCVNVELPT